MADARGEHREADSLNLTLLAVPGAVEERCSDLTAVFFPQGGGIFKIVSLPIGDGEKKMCRKS